MRDFGQEVPDKLEAPSGEMRLMRHRLIDEENNELFSARTDAERVDAIADLLVVVVGAAEDAGIDPETLEAHLEDVLNANEAKKWTAEQVAKKPDGWIATPIRETGLFSVRDRSGKIRKPPGWIAPDASRHIDAQRRQET
jgi:predicted HAD superfamily Cof-like phosphohydrolase